MNVTMKFDTKGITDAVNRLRPLMKKTKTDLVKQAAKGFTATAIEITPPASKGKTGSKAKAQGQQAIQSDLAKIMVAVRKKRDLDTRPGAASPEELHKRFRDPRTGRINRRALAHPYKVQSSELRALQAKLFARVGWLASGWNKAAEKLGISGRSWPEWIQRHSGSPGYCNITDAAGRFRVEIANTVPFIGNVKDLSRRIQAAVDYQANAMNREAVFLLKRAIKEAGWT